MTRRRATTRRAPTFTQFVCEVLGVDLTRAQIVFCRVAFDAEPCCSLALADRELAKQMFGELPGDVPSAARAVLAWIKGARAGGTMIAAFYLLWRAVTADCSALGLGETAFCVAVAPDQRLARQLLGYVKGGIAAVPALGAMVTAESTDRVELSRPDGRRVAIEALPATRGGAATRGRTYLAAVLDEASFFRDGDSGAINDVDIFRSLVTRVVLGGMLVVPSTAWLETALLHQLVQKNHGRPVSALAAITPTLLMRGDDERVRAVVAAERERDPFSAATEFDCQPKTSTAEAFLDFASVTACTDPDRPLEIALTRPYPARAICVDLGFVRDSSAAVLVYLDDDTHHVAEIHEWRPQPGLPLKPSLVYGEIVRLCTRADAPRVLCDGHYSESAREYFADHGGLELVSLPAGAGGKETQYLALKSVVHECRLQMPKHERLSRQLTELRGTPRQGGGVAVSSPRHASGGHGDIASALAGAVWALEQLRTAPRQRRTDFSLLPPA